MTRDPNYSPFGRRPTAKPPVIKLLYPLWRVRSADGYTVRSAGIYETGAGDELRVDENGDFQYSERSRAGVNLIETANALRDVYLAQGWVEIE